MISWVKKLFKNSNSSSETVEEPSSKFAELEKKLGYSFKNQQLLESALTHPSFTADEASAEQNNQRLEFLGDSVLALILAEKLYAIFPNEREGVLAKSRAALAKGAFLAKLGRKLGLATFLRMSRHEEKTGGHLRASTLEDALEAIVGAIYLDSDFAQTRAIVLPWYGEISSVLEQTLAHDNPKGKLQESIQSESPQRSIEYKILEAAGPDHKKVFTVEVLIDGDRRGQGSGHSKKEAEEAAARIAIQELEQTSS